MKRLRIKNLTSYSRELILEHVKDVEPDVERIKRRINFNPTTVIVAEDPRPYAEPIFRLTLTDGESVYPMNYLLD